MKPSTLRFTIGAAVILLAGTGCSLDTFRTRTGRGVSGEPESLKYASALGVNLDEMTRTSSGLYYKDRTVGSGATAEKGRNVRVAYKGWLADGHVFDQSAPGHPYDFVLGNREVIDGWDEGIVGMRQGGRRLLVIPPSLAYGQQSPGPGIPANATLVFDVTLDSVDP